MLDVRPHRVERYAELGIDRVVLGSPTMKVHDADATLRHLDKMADLVTQFGGS